MRFIGINTCRTCYLTAAGYDRHELGHETTRQPLSLVDGPCIPEGHLSDFGRLPCEGCGDDLAGARYAVSVDTRTN